MYLSTHIYFLLIFFCLKALESCLNGTSGAKITERRNELMVCSWIFSLGVYVFSDH